MTTDHGTTDRAEEQLHRLSTAAPEIGRPEAVSTRALLSAGRSGLRFPIRADTEEREARAAGRRLAAMLGFSPADAGVVATIVSELESAIRLDALAGEIFLSAARGTRAGIVIEARQQGPVSSEVGTALQRRGRMLDRLRAPSGTRLADELRLVSETGRGTAVTVTKWRP